MHTKIITAADSEAKKAKIKPLDVTENKDLINLSEKNKNLQDRKPKTTEKAQKIW